MKYNEAEKKLINLEAETNRLRSERKNPEFWNIDEECAELLKEKEKEMWIRRYDSVANDTLQKIVNERVMLCYILGEINEAREAGEKVMSGT